MEVHKSHNLTHKKKWGEYLLEFFMLFLAVFLGFIAENVRETSAEHEHEKQYAQQLYTEFYADSIAFAKKVNARLDKEPGLRLYVQLSKRQFANESSKKILSCLYHSILSH